MTYTRQDAVPVWLARAMEEGGYARVYQRVVDPVVSAGEVPPHTVKRSPGTCHRWLRTTCAWRSRGRLTCAEGSDGSRGAERTR